MDYENKKLEEFNNFIRFRKIAIIGLGVSNMPLLDYLYNKKAKVSIFDERKLQDFSKDILDKISRYGFELHTGINCLSGLKGFSIIFRSPSCMPTRPELVEEEKNGALVTTEIETLMKLCPSTIIGVTGSEGKTTTTSIINKILEKGNKKVYLGGNIGTPLLTKVDEMKPEDVVVLELSSFQLMEMDISPQIAVLTNITPNHLNIHKDYEEYIDAKKNIFKYQEQTGKVILNYDNEITKNCEKEAKGKVVFFSSKKKLSDGYIVDKDIVKKCDDGIREYVISEFETNLKGVHNLENICAAIAATEDLVDIETIKEAIREFKPVEHRLEFVRELNGVKWYNDSASSSPTRTIAGLNAFDKENIVLIAGGSDKNLDYLPIAKPIVDKVKTLILIGETSKKIKEVVEEEAFKQKKNIKIHKCYSLLEAVKMASKEAMPKDIVLFSPASASFDMFKNAYDRGNQFKDLVKFL